MLSNKIKASVLAVVVLALSACSSSTFYAPVTTIGKPEIPSSGTYQVKAGDTLYSIAWAYAIDYRQLAALNGLSAPYRIQPGQRLRLKGQPVRQTRVVQRKSSHHQAVARKPLLSVRHWSSPVKHWSWPARGRLIAKFSSGYTGNPGIDIAGRRGEPVRASASGVVVYSGTGVRGYGNLIIIKHNNSFLSAYAFNQVNLVKQGATVKAGQVIAKMGQNNAGKALLHFEIRRNGKPVNPLKFLS